ncbi:MAG: hypothetical protein LBF12_01235 [Christensenellaceae bacterium]|nr:hypothetical protein [Christensenellaceae bacterium]
MFVAAVQDAVKLTGILIDVGVIVLAIIVALIGMKIGFLKIFKGLMASLLTVAIAVMLVSPIQKALYANTKLESNLSNTLATRIGSFFSIESGMLLRYIPEDSDVADGPVGIVYVDGEEVKSIDSLESDGNIVDFRKIAIKYLVLPKAEKYFEDTPEGTLNVLKTLSDNVSYIIMLVIVFVLLAIALRIVIGILLMILKKIIATFYIAHFIDRLIGFVIGAALVAGLLYLVLGVLKAFEGQSFMDQVKTGIESTSLVKFLYNDNAITPMVQAIVDKIMKKG